MENESDTLRWRHGIEHDQEGHGDRLVEGDQIEWVAVRGAVAAADPLIGFRQRLRDPLADVALSTGSCRTEKVKADAGGDRREPGTGGLNGCPLSGRHG